LLTSLYKSSIVTIFCSTYAILDEKLFSKSTDSYVKEYKLYDKLLDKITLETELSTLIPSKKDEPALVPISIPPTKKNLHNYSLSSSLSYKSPSLTYLRV